jgi:uncharacterized protein (TIGR04255 family)
VSKINRWEFANKESDTGFIIQADSFVYHTTNYSGFKEFIEEFEFALSQVNDAVEISLVERIGLRYIDAVEPNKGDALDSYIVEGLAGFPLRELGVNMLISHTEAVAQTSLGTLLLKATIKNDDRVLPPDLSPVGLTVRRSVSADTPTAIFDFDHYCEKSIEFSVEEVVKRMSKLHAITSNAFWTTVTEHAIQQWK